MNRDALVCLYKAAKGRAVSRQIAFLITMADMEAIAERCDGKCEISGIPFNETKYGDARTRPFAPSLDRINPKLGYIPANCRFVCVAVNYAMGDWGEAVLKQVAAAVISKAGRMDIQHTGDMRHQVWPGVVRRPTTKGFTYYSLIRQGGKIFTVGRYGTPAQAHLRYLEVKKALDDGGEVLDFVTLRSRQIRKKTTPIFTPGVNGT